MKLTSPGWKPTRVAALLALFAAVARLGAAAESELTSGKLAAGTPHETPYYIQRTGVPGPTVMLVGGVHGNEPAGAHAVDVVRYWPLARGTLISVPRANPTALAAAKRRMPDTPRELSDLNRQFPQLSDTASTAAAELRHPLAAALWELTTEHRPDWLVDAHEGYDFHQLNSDSVGSSVIASQQSDAREMAESLLAAVNAEIDDAPRQFVLRGPPIAGSLARAAATHLDARALILETTSKEQRLPHRARQHRQMLHTFFARLGMLDEEVDVDTFITPLVDAVTIEIGLFDDGGVSGNSFAKLERQLGDRPKLRLVRVDAADICAGACDEFEVLLFSGGSGSKQGIALDEIGRERVREFVERGGTYVGICAGAYLASSGFDWGLDLLDVRTKSREWRRGRGQVQVEFTDAGRLLLLDEEDSRERAIFYANGPVWQPAEDADLADAEILASYRTELAKNDTPEGIMIDSPAMLRGQYGAGAVYAFSCHPEATAGCEEFVFRAIAEARSRQLEGAAAQ